MSDNAVIDELAQLVVHDEDEAKVDTTSDPPSETVEKDVLAPSQEEQKAITPEDPAEKKEVPFHKHPRWIRQQNELRELREQLAKRDTGAYEVIEEREAKDSQIPREFVDLFGDNPEAYKAYKALNEKHAREIIAAERAAEKAERERIAAFQQKAVQAAEDALLELSEETGLDLTDQNSTERNQILSICDKYKLFDANGVPNIVAGNELRAVLYPAKSDVTLEEKKKVVAKTNVKTNAIPKEDSIFTTKSLKKMSMSQFFN